MCMFRKRLTCFSHRAHKIAMTVINPEQLINKIDSEVIPLDSDGLRHIRLPNISKRLII